MTTACFGLDVRYIPRDNLTVQYLLAFAAGHSREHRESTFLVQRLGVSLAANTWEQGTASTIDGRYGSRSASVRTAVAAF